MTLERVPSVGDQMPTTEITVRRVDLIRYCGACGDYTGTHWNGRVAQLVGLPDVIAHGTLNIALAARVVSDWVGNPVAVLGYSVDRFTNPLVVPDDDTGTTLTVSGYVEEVCPETSSFTMRLRAKNSDGKPVMGGARVRISTDYSALVNSHERTHSR